MMQQLRFYVTAVLVPKRGTWQPYLQEHMCLITDCQICACILGVDHAVSALQHNSQCRYSNTNPQQPVASYSDLQISALYRIECSSTEISPMFRSESLTSTPSACQCAEQQPYKSSAVAEQLQTCHSCTAEENQPALLACLLLPLEAAVLLLLSPSRYYPKYYTPFLLPFPNKP